MNNKSKLTDTYYVARVFYKSVKRKGLPSGPILTTTIIREKKDGNYIDCRMPSSVLSFDKDSHVEGCPKSINGYVYCTLSDSFELAMQPKGEQISLLISEKRKEKPVVLRKHVPHVGVIHVGKKDTK